MNNKKLDLGKLDVSNSDLIELYKISMCAIDIAAHDFASSVSLIGGYSEIATRYLTRISETLSTSLIQPDTSKNIDLLTEVIDRSKDTSHKILNLFDFFFRQYRDYQTENMFVAKPINIINQLIRIHEGTEIKVDQSSLESIEIVFPENVLFGIMTELIRNASKAIDGTCTVLIKWFVSNNRFYLEVHDDGPGITKNLNYTLLPLDVLEIKLSGLNIINKIKSYAKGNLLFNKSELLGGTCVHIDFPIMAYYLDGKTYELK